MLGCRGIIQRTCKGPRLNSVDQNYLVFIRQILHIVTVLWKRNSASLSRDTIHGFLYFSDKCRCYGLNCSMSYHLYLTSYKKVTHKKVLDKKEVQESFSTSSNHVILKVKSVNTTRQVSMDPR